MPPRFNAKRERQFLEQCIIDCDLANLDIRESILYIKAKMGVEVSPQYIWRIKKKMNSDPFINRWLHDFTKIGYLKDHRERYDEMKKLQAEAWRLLFVEIARPELPKAPGERKKSITYILKIMEQIRENNVRLTELQNGTPILAQVKARLERPDGSGTNESILRNVQTGSNVSGGDEAAGSGQVSTFFGNNKEDEAEREQEEARQKAIRAALLAQKSLKKSSGEEEDVISSSDENREV